MTLTHETRRILHYERRLAQMGRKAFTVQGFCQHAQFNLDVENTRAQLRQDHRLTRINRPGPETYQRTPRRRTPLA